jgi:hypothetical protein
MHSATGVDTVVQLNCSPAQVRAAQEAGVAVVRHPHAAMDNIGINLLFDKIEAEYGPLEAVPCNSFERSRPRPWPERRPTVRRAVAAHQRGTGTDRSEREMGSARANYEDIVKISVIGEITSSWRHPSPYAISVDGEPVVLPGATGIVYNVRVGDRAVGWMADHLEPGVGIRNSDEGANGALNILSCIGNEAVVVSGDAKGARGTVTGKHGRSEYLIVDFTPAVLEQLFIGDRIQVRAYGRGLELLDAPEVKLLNMSVELLRALPLEIAADGTVEVPVAAIVPAELMGSGYGATSERGDYDIQTVDEAMLCEHGLDSLRLGDLVAVRDQDHSFGRSYRKGGVIVGVVVHGDSCRTGNGPGVTTLMSSPTGKLRPRIESGGANIATLLGLR